MKKLVMIVALAVAVLGAAKWKHEAQDGRRGNLAVNRFWVDHLPTSERDPFNVFVAHTPEGFGGFAEETQWKGQIERFRFDVEGNTIHAVFPWSNTREDIKLDARPCQEQDMDYCRELSGSSHGVKRYYSRKGWQRRSGEDIEAFKARAFVL
ncbi:hypothetical protein BH11MYX2_BH11MYX2_14940 [soil metagenome]